MKNLLRTILTTALALNASLALAQTQKAEGLEFSYKNLGKTDSRYDEYCKQMFDVYTVEATVTNENTDKAAVVNAILSYPGKACNKIYSDNGPIGGEIIDKPFQMNVSMQTQHVSQHWVNRYVDLLPTDSMSATTKVEVLQGESLPEPFQTFTYELLPGANTDSNQANTQQEPASAVEEPSRFNTESHNYNQLIVGKWVMTHVHISQGGVVSKNENLTPENGYYQEFTPTGKLLFWGVGGVFDESPWRINDNQLIAVPLGDDDEPAKILTLNDSTLIIQKDSADQGIITSTFTRIP